jgi:hypothetical protein
MAIQINRAPRTALGREQHDIARKRLKVDNFLAATTRFAGDAETLPSQRRGQGKPCPARAAPRHPKRKITGCRPTVATEIFRIIASRANKTTLRVLRWERSKVPPTQSAQLLTLTYFGNRAVPLRLAFF